MAYVPRKRKLHLSWKITVPVVVFIVCISLSVLYITQNTPSKEAEIFRVCGWNEKKMSEKLMHSYPDTYAISDYLYYGESLDFFSEDYGPEAKNDLARKNLQLVNLCDEESLSYTLESSLDRQIDTAELEPGFYEIFVSDNQVKKRLIYDEELENNIFTTVTRDGKVKEIEVIANQNILPDGGKLEQNYVFINVEEAEPSNEYIDVYIDPYGNIPNVNGVIEKGNEANGISENQEMYDAAISLKSKLEAYGLRVEVSKKARDEALSYYGKDGRMARAYEKHARYYLELGMNSSQVSSYRGMEIFHSSYASNTLASSLLYALKKNTQLPASNAYTWSDRNEGVASASLIIGEDGLKIYDNLPSLRESGGKATFSASMNTLAKENASFAKENVEGMMALSINPIYISNSEDVNYWKEHKELILSELAKAFVTSIHVSEE